MRYHFFTIALFSLVSLIFAAETENYRVASLAAAAKGVTLEEGKRYAFYEYWVVSRYASFPDFPECVTGYKHIRLIVGSVAKATRANPDQDFKANAWDLYVTNPEEAKKKLEGAPVATKPESWKANRNTAGNPVTNQCVYAGRVSKSDQGIKTAGEHITPVSMPMVG